MLTGPAQAEYPFFDLASGGEWTIRMSNGRLPRWIFDADARVPDTQPADDLALLPVFFARPGRTVDEAVRKKGRMTHSSVRFCAPCLMPIPRRQARRSRAICCAKRWRRAARRAVR